MISISVGPIHIDLSELLSSVFFRNSSYNPIIWHIRLPRVLSATIAGMGLSIAGCVMQCVLRNPLGSPFTLGISQAAAFGAAFAIIYLKCRFCGK